MRSRFATRDNISKWDDLIAANPGGGNPLQGAVFASIKQAAGWKIRYILIDSLAITAMEKFVFGLGKVWYIPKGPTVMKRSDLAKVIEPLSELARKNSVFTIKIEPELGCHTDMGGLNLTKTRPIQYNYATILVDLTPDLDDIFKGLNQKARNAIRRAEREGVVVRQVEPTDANCQIMFDMLKSTAESAKFAIRPFEYYKRFYQAYGKAGGLFFAYLGDRPISGAFAFILGQKSMYKDGASVRDHPAYGASHLLQWEVIKWVKANGSLEHDLAGAPPIKDANNPNHPFYGLGRFKSSFNKTFTEYVGAYEVPVRPVRSWLWTNFFEIILRRAYFKLHGESWY